MALTRLDRVGDGSTTVYDVSFTLGYLKKEYVYVYLEGDAYTTQLDYAWLNTNQIELNSPLGVGVKFSIRRVVERNTPVNDYEAGAILRESNLDDSFVQSLMILEEIEDGYIVTDGDFLLVSDIDMRGHKVTNSIPATNYADLVTLGQMTEVIAANSLTGAANGSTPFHSVESVEGWTKALLTEAGVPEPAVPDTQSESARLAALKKVLLPYNVFSRISATPVEPRFGAKFDGTTDDTAAINLCTAWVENQGGGNVVLPAGTAVLGTLTPTIYSTVAGVLAGYNSWALLYARNNVTVMGTRATTLKVADGLVATNATLAGTKGYQVFVHKDYLTPVNNFHIVGFEVDMNGLNNLMQPLNAYGNQSLCHGIYIELGNDNSSESIRWKNHSGHQIVLFQYGTTKCKILNNEFENCGWLNGANPLLTDHSSIYCAGQDWEVRGNILVQPTIVPVGAGLELHGMGVAEYNRVTNYAAIGNLAAVVTTNNNITINNNYSRGTGGGWGLYCTGNRTLDVTLRNNNFQLNGKVATPFPLVGEFKQMFYAGENSVFADGSRVTIDSKDNHYAVDAAIEWVGEEADLLSTFLVAQSVENATFQDTIEGFRGPIVELQRSLPTGRIKLTGCTVKNCGRSNSYATVNAMVNYTNAADVSYGNPLFVLEFYRNNYTGNKYAAYLSVQFETIGIALAPRNFTILGDAHDSWLPPIVASTGNAATNLRWNLQYHCEGEPTSTKPLSERNRFTNQTTGEIESYYPEGWKCTFKTWKDINQWNFSGTKYSIVSPTTPRPFGDNIGDTYKVLLVAGGSPCEFRCTAAGADEVTLGTWASLTLS